MKNYLGTTVENSNGNKYLVLMYRESKNGFEKVLLQLIPKESSSKITEYVVARNYDLGNQSWARGSYFPVFKSGFGFCVDLENTEEELNSAVQLYLFI